jgi:hypothetical protein
MAGMESPDMGPRTFCICLGLLLFSITLYGVVTGRTPGLIVSMDRNRQPVGFWMVQAGNIALGVVMFYVAYQMPQN